MINCCRLFLQIISLADMLLYDLQNIHPSYRQGEQPPSRQSTVYWLTFDNPPKHYWKLWSHFIHFYVDPLVASSRFSWCLNPPVRHKIILFKHRQFFHLYRVVDRDVTEFCQTPPTCGWWTPSYLNIPYFSDIQHDDPNLIPADAHYSKEGLTFCGYASLPLMNAQTPIYQSSLAQQFLNLPSSIRNICRSVTFPTDDGMQLVTECKKMGIHYSALVMLLFVMARQLMPGFFPQVELLISHLIIFLYMAQVLWMVMHHICHPLAVSFMGSQLYQS
jgi:hypothetical protein